MGLFDFFNKKKKTADAISASRNLIMQTIETMKVSCRDSDTLRMLNEIKNTISSQPESKKEEIVRVDAQILNLLEVAGDDMASAMYANARSSLYDVQRKLTERAKMCSMGGTPAVGGSKGEDYLEKLRKKFPVGEKSSIDQLNEEIRNENRMLEESKRKFEDLRKLYEESGSEYLLTEADGVDLQIIEHQNNIRILNSYLKTLRQHETMNKVNKAGERWKSEVDEAEIDDQVTEMEFDHRMEDLQNREDRNSRIGDKLHASATGGRGANVFDRRENATASSNVFDRRAGANATASTSSAQAGPAKQTQFGGFDASQMSSREMERDIKKTINEIERQIEDCNDKIDDASDEFNDYNAQLRTLLARRENASPSDCLTLDGQIDELNSRRSGVMNKIKRYRQIKANLSDRLSLMEKLGTQQDVSAMTDRIQEVTGGRFADIEGLAMYLKQSVADSNEELENIGIAVAVSESEEISFGSTSATYAGLTDATNVNIKDENKYDSLKLDLGMPV